MDELANVLEEKDGMIIELEEQCKRLEQELDKSQLFQKDKVLRKTNSMMGNNPLAQASINI